MSEKPAWALTMREASRAAEEYVRKRDQADAMRCPEYDSSSARCTADAEPSHEHRYDRGDLP